MSPMPHKCTCTCDIRLQYTGYCIMQCGGFGTGRIVPMSAGEAGVASAQRACIEDILAVMNRGGLKAAARSVGLRL